VTEADEEEVEDTILTAEDAVGRSGNSDVEDLAALFGTGFAA
jgi:hypothetical protein